MSYLEIKTIKGRKYKYERTSYREGEIVKHKSKYLGAVEPLRVFSNAGRKPKLKVRNIDEKEKYFITTAMKSSKSFVKDRAKIIKLSAEGTTVKQIFQKLKFYRPKVEKIIKDFNKYGLKIFERKKSSGKPRRITKEERAKILYFLNTHPEKLGLHFNNWSHKKISEYAKKQRIKVSPSHVGRIIKQDEIKYKKKKARLYSNDENFFQRN